MLKYRKPNCISNASSLRCRGEVEERQVKSIPGKAGLMIRVKGAAAEVFSFYREAKSWSAGE